MIAVENLSKKYILGHQKNGSYVALRDILSIKTNQIVKRILNPFKKTVTESSLNEEFWALKNINFEINQGDRVGIIGRNGAGKSTLLKILSRITEPTTGSVKIKGRVASLLEVGTGFHPELTGRENIFLNGAILGMSRFEILRKFDEIVSFAEVEKFLDTPVKRYSSGMYVRLAFAVAAHLEPEILVVDEVLAVGDSQFQKKCLGKMEDVSKEGRTVLFVSHNMSAIAKLCNKALLLSGGELVFQGNASETIKQYMNAGANKNERMEWIAPRQSLPFDDHLIVKKYYIQEISSSDVPTNILYTSRSYNIIIETEIKKSDPNLTFLMSFYLANENSLLFVSDLHDSGDQNISKLTPGHKIIVMPLPINLLAEKDYEIELSCCLYTRAWILLPNEKNRLKFSVVNDVNSNPMPDNTNHPLTGKEKPGLIAPVIPWEIR